MGDGVTRREMVKAAALAAAGLPAARLEGAQAPAASPAGVRAGDPWRGFKAGVASYTLRKLPLEGAIAAVQRVGLRYVSIKDFHLPLTSTADERKAVARRFQEAGITPLSCGNISMENDAASVRRAFEYARDAGIPTIVCSPHPDSMPILDAMVKEFGTIRLAIHNHGPEDKRFPSPYDVWKAVEKYDPRVGLCIDVGHTARAKVNPAEAIRRCRERLYDLHMKDITSTEPDGKTVEGGRGVLDMKSILAALLEVRYPHLLSFEYEKDENDPLPGLSETIGYTRGLLNGMA
jgi:sugar phosphate isomerase/epimerase